MESQLEKYTAWLRHHDKYTAEQVLEQVIADIKNATQQPRPVITEDEIVDVLVIHFGRGKTESSWQQVAAKNAAKAILSRLNHRSKLNQSDKETVPDLSKLDGTNKDEFIKDFIEMTAKNVLSVFVALGLKTHIEAMVVNDYDGSEYILSFTKHQPELKEDEVGDEYKFKYRCTHCNSHFTQDTGHSGYNKSLKYCHVCGYYAIEPISAGLP